MEIFYSNGALAILGVIATIFVAARMRRARVFIIDRQVVHLLLLVVIFMTAFDLLLFFDVLSFSSSVVLSRVFRAWFKISMIAFAIRAIDWKSL